MTTSKASALHGAQYAVLGYGYTYFADTYEQAIERALRDPLTHERAAVVYSRVASITDRNRHRYEPSRPHQEDA